MSDLRLTGMATGINTQETIDKILKYSRAPLDRLEQDQQLLLWKQEAYRTQNTSITNLRDMVFSMKLESSYQIKKTSTTNDKVVTATASANAVDGSYSIAVTKLASVAFNQSSDPVSIRSSVIGEYHVLSSSPITLDATNKQIKVKVDNEVRTLTLTEAIYDGSAGKTMSDLAADIQTQLNAAGFSTDVFVRTTDDHELRFYTAQKNDGTPHTIVLKEVVGDNALARLGFNSQASSKELVSDVLAVTDPTIHVTAQSNTFKITVGNEVSQTIQVTDGDYTLANLATAIEGAIQAKGGEYANVFVTKTEYNQLRLTYRDPDLDDNDNPLSIKLECADSSDLLWQMGFDDGTVSDYPRNPIDPDGTIFAQESKFINHSFFAGKTESSSFTFAINGQAFVFNMSNTLQDIMDTINENTAAGVSVYYDNFSDKLCLTSTRTGNNNESGKEILLTDPDGFLGNVFNVTEAGESGGENAEFTFNGIATQRTSNSFTMNNTTFTLTGVGGPATVVVNSDNSEVTSKVEAFVNAYNDLVKAVTDELAEPKAKSNKYNYYKPLTAAQKEEMSETEIEAWEAKAKEGLLYHDSLLDGTLRELRLSLSRVVKTPCIITGNALSGTIDLSTGNRFQVTVGGQTREIILDVRSYTSSQYDELADDIQSKLDLSFGVNTVQVSMSDNKLSFTTQNISMSVSHGTQSTGLGVLGFSSGQTTSGGYDRLEQIGITTGDYTEYGKLYFNKTTFESALEADPDAVLRLFTNFEEFEVESGDTDYDIAQKELEQDSRKGIFYKLHDVLTTQISRITSHAGMSGNLSNTNYLGRLLIQNAQRMEVVEDRLQMEEDRLWRIFSSMETTINKYNAQAAWLMGLVGGSQPSSGQ